MEITSVVRKVLLMAASGTTSVIMAACYGTTSMFENRDYRVSIHARNAADEPIEGLEVVVTCSLPDCTALNS